MEIYHWNSITKAAKKLKEIGQINQSTKKDSTSITKQINFQSSA